MQAKHDWTHSKTQGDQANLADPRQETSPPTQFAFAKRIPKAVEKPNQLKRPHEANGFEHFPSIERRGKPHKAFGSFGNLKPNPDLGDPNTTLNILAQGRRCCFNLSAIPPFKRGPKPSRPCNCNQSRTLSLPEKPLDSSAWIFSVLSGFLELPGTGELLGAAVPPLDEMDGSFGVASEGGRGDS